MIVLYRTNPLVPPALRERAERLSYPVRTIIIPARPNPKENQQ